MILLFLSLLSISAWSASHSEWKTIAQTSSCRDEVRIEARENEKFVYAYHKNLKRKLLSKDGTAYKKIHPKNLTFVSDTTHEKYQLGDATFDFQLPATVMSHPPSVTIYLSGTYSRCDMVYKD